MVELPDRLPKSVAAIYAWYEAQAEDPRREHLGASKIGHYCNRHLWYHFRWANEQELSGRAIRLFDTGHQEEERIARDLIRAGVELEVIDPDTGEQWLFSWFGGHFGGHCDGIGKGFPEAPKSLHVFEAKSANKKWFKTIGSKGVREAKADHWAQMQVYMHGTHVPGGKRVKRAFYVATCKDTDELYVERVQYDKVEAEALVAKAERVVFSQHPLEKITDDVSSYLCEWCDHRTICQFEQVADLQRNCRTCLSSTPRPDGTWWCDHFDAQLSLEDQRAGCQQHLFIPGLLPWEVQDAKVEERRVIYQRADGTLAIDGNMKLEDY